MLSSFSKEPNIVHGIVKMIFLRLSDCPSAGVIGAAHVTPSFSYYDDATVNVLAIQRFETPQPPPLSSKTRRLAILPCFKGYFENETIASENSINHSNMLFALSI
jgi:hypothetical protein